jgi:Anti-sigma-K factor rskA, C-terminal
MEEARPSDRELSIGQRESDLKVQLEQVHVALQQLRQTQESMHGLETRLADLTRDCAAILERWAKNDEKHAAAVVELHSRLGEWNDIERRLLNESTTRIHQFERSLQHEWSALKQSHEEPIRQLDAQTTRITEACLSAVDQALRGFERAEARLSTLEQELHREMSTLSREVREALADLRQKVPELGARQPWSLDNVVRLHNELRSEGEGAGAPALAVAGGVGHITTPARGTLALADPLPLDRIAPMAHRTEQHAFLPADPIATHTGAPTWRRPAVLVGLLALGVAAFALYEQSQVRSSLHAATSRAEAAERGATQTRQRAEERLEAVRKASDERLQLAQQTARSAQALATLLAAPDLYRFDLAADDTRVAAQVLWSRSQGIAFSASRLPAPPAGQAYQLWLLTPTRTTSVGLISPDANGRASALFDPIANLPRPIVRAMMTVEDAAGALQPTATPFLASPEPLARSSDATPAPPSPAPAP